jgi:hypothetical protein
MQPELIGYFPKRVTRAPEWLTAPQVREICSVSECVAQGPEGWIENWTHNDLGVYDTLSAASERIPTDERTEFQVFAYRLVPRLFDKGSEISLTLPPIAPEPLPERFASLGFDVVSRSMGASFECSPLSCNDMASEIATNEFCLVETIERAIEVALQFSLEEPEPGPYVVIEVMRERL